MNRCKYRPKISAILHDHGRTTSTYYPKLESDNEFWNRDRLPGSVCKLLACIEHTSLLMKQAMSWYVRVLILGAIVRACETLCCSSTTVFYTVRRIRVSSIISDTVHSVFGQMKKVQMSLQSGFGRRGSIIYAVISIECIYTPLY